MTRSRFSTFYVFAGIAAGGLLLGAAIGRYVSSRQPPPTPFAPTPAVHVEPTMRLPVAADCRKGCRETFETLAFTEPPTWRRDVPSDRSTFADNGSFFHDRDPSFAPPAGYRISAPFGQQGFLTLESYSRTAQDPQQLFTIVQDPADPANHVLRIASPDHTDGTILRTTSALGARYSICARVGYMEFGTGDGTNGYHRKALAEPWGAGTATNENGFYFGAISHSVPQPHNNILAHHERLLFIDSDNNTEGWTQIWAPDLRSFFRSGWHPIVMAALDTRGAENDETGFPFAAYAAGGWNPPGQILAVDAYKDRTWYTACVARAADQVTLRISGDFRFGGMTTYEAVLADTSHVPHFHDPHYWWLGDPHINYYEGTMLVDDVTLTVGDTPPR